MTSWRLASCANIAEKTITLLETLDEKLEDFDNTKYLE